MNDIPESRNNADLPRPRHFSGPVQNFQTGELPPLKRRGAESGSPVHTQEFQIPRKAKTSDEFQTQEIEIPASPEFQEEEEDFPGEDVDYGAYEEYDRPARRKKNTSGSARTLKNSINPQKIQKNRLPEISRNLHTRRNIPTEAVF